MGPSAVAAWQHSLVMGVVLLAALSMMASLVFSAFRYRRVDAAFRPAFVVSSLLAVIGSSQALQVLLRWQGAGGGTGLTTEVSARFPVWALTVPLVLCGLVSVQRLSTRARGPVMRLVASSSFTAVVSLAVMAGSSTLWVRLISGALGALTLGAALVALLWWLPKVSPSRDPTRRLLLHVTTGVLLGAIGLSALALGLSQGLPNSGAVLVVAHLMHAAANVSLSALPAVLFWRAATVGMLVDPRPVATESEHEAQGQHRAVGASLIGLGLGAVVAALVVAPLNLQLQLIDASTMAVFAVAVAVAGWWQLLQARERFGPTHTSRAQQPADQPDARHHPDARPASR
jgi:hypothetical protein